MQNILITGATGLIGTATIAHLKNRYKLSALNRRPLTTIPCHRADISDLKAIEPAFKNIDTVIHLAAHIGNNHRAIQHANIQGTTNIFEASLNAGVRRIIFASSGSVVGGYGQHAPYKELLAGDYSAIGDTWPMLTHESPCARRASTRPAKSGAKSWPAPSPMPATAQCSACVSAA